MRSYHFGRYTLQRQPLRLYDGKRVVKLTTRQLHVLSLLARAQGNTVTREQFLKQVWGDSVVEEANLTQTIFMLRRLLGRAQSDLQLIETVAKVGYRIAPEAFRVGYNESSDANLLSAVRGDGAQYLPLIVQSVTDFALYMLDCSGRVRTWNPGAEELKGYSEQEAVGKHYAAFFTPEDSATGMPESLLARAVRNGRVAGEGWRIRKNGERFWASFVLTTIRNSAGRHVGFAKAVHDITEHKLREDALTKMETVARQERDCFLAVAESSMDAIYICSAVRDANDEIVDFTFTFLNGNVEKMVSIPRKILLGGNMLELLPANRVLGLFEEYKQVVLTGKPFVSTFPINVEEVSSEWIRVRAVRLGDGIVISASDISEQKRAEERARVAEQSDLLTGLGNRRAALDFLSAFNAGEECDENALLLCHVSIPSLGAINRSDGEKAGDDLLSSLSSRLIRMAAQNRVFRTGGAEFLAVIPGHGPSDLAKREALVRNCVRQPLTINKLNRRINCISAISVIRRGESSSECAFQTSEDLLKKQGPL